MRHAGIPYFRSKRLAPSTRRFVATLRATVCGEPTYSAPSGPVSRSSMVLADPEEVHACLLGDDSFLDDAADRLGVRHQGAVGVAVAIPEGVRHGRLSLRSNRKHKRTFPRLYSGSRVEP